MMDFFTHYYKKKHFKVWWWLCCAWLLLGVQGVWAQNTVDLSQFRVERADDEVQLTAQLQFELSAVVEDALAKGVPMVFVASAELLRERWYWYDKKITLVERHLRLAYQPLTRRWRLNQSAGQGSTNVGLALNQSYDTLGQALAAIKRINKWKIADTSDLDANQKYRVDFRFKLDLSQLPRPFQIGALGQSDWDLSSSATATLLPEGAK